MVISFLTPHAAGPTPDRRPLVAVKDQRTPAPCLAHAQNHRISQTGCRTGVPCSNAPRRPDDSFPESAAGGAPGGWGFPLLPWSAKLAALSIGPEEPGEGAMASGLG